VLVQEEVPRAEEADPSLVNFPRAYVPPRKLIAKQVILQKEVKYDMLHQ
jgi:hypothetical protein